MLDGGWKTAFRHNAGLECWSIRFYSHPFNICSCHSVTVRRILRLKVPFVGLNVSHLVCLTSCSLHAHSAASWAPVRAAHVHKPLTDRYFCHYKGKKKNKNHNDKLTVNLPTFCILSVLDVNWLELSCKRLSGKTLCLCSLLLNCASCRHTEQQQADRSSVFLLATEIKRGTCSKVIFLFFFFRKWCYVNWSVSESW